MHKFDYSFLNDGLLPANLINVTASIASLKIMEDVRKYSNLKIFTELEAIAKVQSVKSSNAIEGIVTSDERIAQIVHQNSAPLNHSEAEISGYRDALNIIHSDYEFISFSESTVLSLHKTLLSVAEDETATAMEQLFLAYMDASSNANINQLLLIPCVILDFLCIHPFKDGNGRMSRLISLFLLYKNGYDVGKYISFEEQINNDKAWYYDALKKSSENWHENKNDYFPFVQNFLTMLYKCYSELDKRFAVVNSNKVSKSERIEATVLNSLVPISKTEICRILPDVSPSTVELVLGRMVKSGVITTIGVGRGTKYIRK